jgi:prepilin-type N-terminal cleavage/methylation domain-containing protein
LANLATGRNGFGGFTIIELLVVIVIIGILAAAGASKYQGIVEGARESTCVSNLSTVNMAIVAWCIQNKPLSETQTTVAKFDTLGVMIGNETAVATPPFTGTDIARTISDRRIWVCPKLMQRLGYSALSEVITNPLPFCRGDNSSGVYWFFNTPSGSGIPSWSGSFYLAPNETAIGSQLVVCLDSGMLKKGPGYTVLCPDDIGIKFRHSAW